MKEKKQKKGFILVVSMLVIMVASVLSAAYYTGTIVQARATQTQLEDTQDFYAVEAGIAYGTAEVDSNPELETHILDLSGGGLSFNSSSVEAVLKFGSAAEITGENKYYKLKRHNGVAVKIYRRGDDTVILSRALDAGGNPTGKTHKYIIGSKSLYKYFQFYDNGRCNALNDWSCQKVSLGWIKASGKLMKQDANRSFSVGGIHINGDLVLEGTGFVNLSELSLSGQMYYRDFSFTEPVHYDYQTWQNSPPKIIYNKEKTVCGAGGCMIDGLAPIPREEKPPYNFMYPLYEDVLRIDDNPLKEARGPDRGWAAGDSVHFFGMDASDDWDRGETPMAPKLMGHAYLWFNGYDADNDGIIDDIEKKFIPKILSSCKDDNNCSWGWDKYYGILDDNFASWQFGAPKLIAAGISGLASCPELPVRFQVINREYKYAALRWLADKEDLPNPKINNVSKPSEYKDAIDSGQWLKTNRTASAGTYVSVSDGFWDQQEYDRVTLLSVKGEPGSDGLSLGAGSGLHNCSEYEIYKYIKSGGAINGSVKNWIEGSGGFAGSGLPSYDTTSDIGVNSSELLDKFFYWWKRRSHHHEVDLAASEGAFPGDTALVPAWERIFWEAWFNYWPPQRQKPHNQVPDKTAGREHNINQEWWEDLVYGNDRPGLTNDIENKNYLNTYNKKQADTLADWLKDMGLLDETNNYENSAVKFDADIEGYHPHSSGASCGGHGGGIIKPLNIKEQYRPMAIKEGILIEQDGENVFQCAVGGEVYSYESLETCLSVLGGGEGGWINKTAFYNPYTIAKGRYDLKARSEAQTDSAKSDYINPCEVFGHAKAWPYYVDNDPATGCLNESSAPPPVDALEIDVAKISSLGINIGGKRIIYINVPGYDVRLVNGKTLPRGGFTLVSPYDVYVQAQKVSEQDMDADFDSDGHIEEDVYRGVFNYEKLDKTEIGQGDDTNFKPAAVITNSRVYLLSSEFRSRKDVFPWSYYYPDYGYSLRNSKFLQEYCWNSWPEKCGKDATGSDISFPSKAAKGLSSPEQLTWSWINPAGSSPRLNDREQRCLLDAGEAKYENDKKDDMVNVVKYPQFFNLAIASPFDPRGYRLEVWKNKHPGKSDSADVPITIEGAFIKIGFWQDGADFFPCRYHTPVDTVVNWYEKKRLGITSGFEYLADEYKVYKNFQYENANYEYEERFWFKSGRPSGDFLASGLETKWQTLSADNAYFDSDTPD